MKRSRKVVEQEEEVFDDGEYDESDSEEFEDLKHQLLGGNNSSDDDDSEDDGDDDALQEEADEEDEDDENTNEWQGPQMGTNPSDDDDDESDAEQREKGENNSVNDGGDSSSDSDSDDSSDDDDDDILVSRKKKPIEFAFSITEDISDDVEDATTNYNNGEDGDNDGENVDSDEEDENVIERAANARSNNKTFSSTDQTEPALKRQKLDLGSIEIKEPKFVKPFNYDELREEQSSRGVVFVQKPFGRDLANRFSTADAIRKFFAEFGTITRVEPEYEFRNRKKHLLGFYVEYERKSIAKRVALSVNGAPISRRDSRTLSVKYISNFNWATIGEHEERKKMYNKMLRLEAEKELRLVKGYKRNLKMAERQQQQQQGSGNIMKQNKLKFKQNQFQKYTMDKNHHLNFLPIFNGAGRDAKQQQQQQ